MDDSDQIDTVWQKFVCKCYWWQMLLKVLNAELQNKMWRWTNLCKFISLLKLRRDMSEAFAIFRYNRVCFSLFIEINFMRI